MTSAVVVYILFFFEMLANIILIYSLSEIAKTQIHYQTINSDDTLRLTPATESDYDSPKTQTEESFEDSTTSVNETDDIGDEPAHGQSILVEGSRG